MEHSKQKKKAIGLFLPSEFANFKTEPLGPSRFTGRQSDMELTVVLLSAWAKNGAL